MRRVAIHGNEFPLVFWEVPVPGGASPVALLTNTIKSPPNVEIKVGEHICSMIYITQTQALILSIYRLGRFF